MAQLIWLLVAIGVVIGLGVYIAIASRGDSKPELQNPSPEAHMASSLHNAP